MSWKASLFIIVIIISMSLHCNKFVSSRSDMSGRESESIRNHPCEADNEPKISAGTVRNSLTSMACACACKYCAL